MCVRSTQLVRRTLFSSLTSTFRSRGSHVQRKSPGYHGRYVKLPLDKSGPETPIVWTRDECILDADVSIHGGVEDNLLSHVATCGSPKSHWKAHVPRRAEDGSNSARL